MLLSIVMPVYKAESSIARTIKSVLNQTYRDFELLIVDDGSPDNSLVIAKEYAANDSRIKILAQKNAGVSAARNRGIDKAQGEIITFIDADDYIDADFYQNLLKPFSLDEEIDISIGGFVREDAGGATVNVLTRASASVIRHNAAIPELFRNRIFRGELCDKAYRYRLLKNIRLNTKIAVAEDLLFNFEIFHKARRIYYAPLWGYHYVVNKESATRKYTRKNLTHIAAVELMRSMKINDAAEKKMLDGVYARALASNILRMLLSGTDFAKEIKDCQRKLRADFINYINAPLLTYRQKLGMLYAILPYSACKILASIAGKWQRNL